MFGPGTGQNDPEVQGICRRLSLSLLAASMFEAQRGVMSIPTNEPITRR